ncbi:histone deacetylase [Zea mays]|uniref:histone deacetylase n=3 Tax=Zea mays TaxID=4577 RepID=Q8LK09_MAIZE|nr:histone deacetylase [Zea mays]AAM93212.1 histone deacetylase HDA110 isoform 1 [Zea mays]ACF78469.1 unknown [Zea mays]ACN27856.1 unknown [Zea mays]|eukprot:NP_001105095.1 histone deacetylase [Zea mays]
MRPPSSGKKTEVSHSVGKCGVSDQACHGKCQSCGIDAKPFCAGVNEVSLLTGSHTDVEASKENRGACSLNNDRADALEEEANVSTARIGHVESADPGGSVGVEKEIFMAVNEESEGEQAGATLEDLFFFNGEEDDDSDWEPASRLVVNRWFCLNCTMPNVDKITYCMNCRELPGSVVDGYDVFKKQIAQTALLSADTGLLPVSTAIGFDERMLLHSELEVKPNPHPERPDRLRAIAASLAAAGIFPSKCALVPPREITKEELLMVHSPDHIESVEQTKNMLYSYFTSDTYANGHSACAAKLAAGLCADLASLIVSGRVRNGFALVRPPGHHAGVKQAMGFCLHNNAAVAALAAKRAGAKKVLIVDWDVHHGNGTQEIFDGDKTVLYISLHRHEDGNFYPGTGAAHEVGVLDGQGFSVNIPWSRGGVGDDDYIFAFQTVVLPIASEFAADITIISAGFDAARGDPLGCCDVTPTGYSWMTSLLAGSSNGRLLVILEGGYNLRSISSSATEVVKVLLGEGPNRASFVVSPSKEALSTVSQVLKIQQQFWPVLGPTYASLQAQQGSVSSNHSNELKKRKRPGGGPGPFWWKMGSKRLLYEALIEPRSRPRKLKGSTGSAAP